MTNTSKYFRTIIDDSDISRGKPHPEIFQKAADALHIKPERCMVIEDSLSGIEAAKRAQCKVIGITSTHKPDELKSVTDDVITDFQDLSLKYIWDLIE